VTTIAAPRRRESDRLAVHVDAHATVYYSSLALIAIAAGWIGRLRWGFWTDEAGSFWMSSGGFAAAIAKTETFPGQSLLYSGIASFFHHPGPNQELWLRLPSILGVLAAGYFLFRLTESIVGQGTGYLAVIPFFCTAAVIAGATNARPYGLALAAATGCGWKFYEFLKTGTRLSFIEHLIFSALVIYLQYFFGFMLALQFAFALYWRWRGHRVPSIMFFVAPATWILSLWPLRESLHQLVRFSQGSYTPPISPTVAQFFLLCFPLGPLLAGAVGCAAIAFAFPRSWKPKFDWPEGAFALTITWLFAAPILFFALARWTPYDLFATRYLLFITPAFFILLASLISWIPATHHRLLILFAILGGTVLHPGNLLQVYAGPAEDWRPALETIRQFPDNPVFVRSGLAESNRIAWRDGARPDSFVLAALSAYPIHNPVLPLPYHLTPEVQQYVKGKLDTDLRNAPRVLLVADDNADVNSWMQSEMKARGYTAHLADRGGYTVSAFEKSEK
jgi:hypothetical protein